MPEYDIQLGRTRNGASSLPETQSLAKADLVPVHKETGGWHLVSIEKLTRELTDRVTTAVAKEVEASPPAKGAARSAKDKQTG